MATMVLGGAFSAIGGPVAGGMGAKLGMMIDSKLFPPKLQNRPTNYQFQMASEGGPDIQTLGLSCRLRGQVLAASQVTPSGGKNVITLAIAISTNQVVGLATIYARGRAIFKASGTTTLVIDSKVHTVGSYLSADQRYANRSAYVVVSVDAKGPDLRQFRAGGANTVTFTGWKKIWHSHVGSAGLKASKLTNPTAFHTMVTNNWGVTGHKRWGGVCRFTNQKSNGDTQMTLYPRFRFNIASDSYQKLSHGNNRQDFPWIAETTDATYGNITITQTHPTLDTKYVGTIAEKSGIANQSRSAHLHSFQPDTPVYNEVAYVVLKDLVIDEFGGAVPDFTMVVSERSEGTATIAECIDTLFTRANWSKTTGSIQYNTDGITQTRTLGGYTMYDSQSLYQRLRPLMLVYDLVAQVREGVVYLLDYANVTTWEIPENDWGFGTNEATNAGLRFSVMSAVKLPTKITLHYCDSEVNFEDSAVDAHIASTNKLESIDTVMNVDLTSMTMTYDEARGVAKRLLYRPWRQGSQFTSTLSSRWYGIVENDIIKTTFNSREIELLVTEVTVGVDDIIQISGQRYHADPPGVDY